MKKILFVLAILIMATPAMAAYYVAGSFNGWTANGLAMTDLGDGKWSAIVQTAPNAREEFKITIGDWSENWPWSGNAWLYADANGLATVIYDTNTYADGWVNTTKRIGVIDATSGWTAVGDWQGWNNGDPATAMVAIGDGTYYYQQTFDTAGSYLYKAVKTGSWDAIGADARSINADTLGFTAYAGEKIGFWVNPGAGTIKVAQVPEPSSLLALLAGLPAIAFLRRKH